MKKFLFWLITDVVWQFLFIGIAFWIMMKYYHDAEYGHGGGDAGMVALLALIYFGIVGIVFIIIHWITSTTIINDFRLSKFIKAKNLIFILQGSFTFLEEAYTELILRHGSTKFEWILYFLLYILGCILIYNFMIRGLAKKLL